MLGQRSKEREHRNLQRKGIVVKDADMEERDGVKTMPCETETEGRVSKCKIENIGASDTEAQDEAETEAKDESKTEDVANQLASGDASNSKTEDNKMVSTESATSFKPMGLPPPAMGLPFMTSVAAQAVMTSRLRGVMSEETFGQDSGEESCSEEDT